MHSTKLTRTPGTPLDTLLEGFNFRWRESKAQSAGSNCMGTALFLTGVEQRKHSTYLCESSPALKKCKLTDVVGPGTLLAWEHHPDFERTGRRNKYFVVHHMAVVKEIEPEILIYHRPGWNKRVTEAALLAADIEQATIFSLSQNFMIFAYSTPLLQKGLSKLTVPRVTMLLADIRAEILTARREQVANP